MIVKTRTYTFCGTPDYVAPEIITGKGYGASVDWWSFGILSFELCAGYTPFEAKHTKELYEKIVSGRFACPNFFSNDLKDLIRNILQVDLSRRFGNLRRGVSDIKCHKWFKDVHWMCLYEQKVEPPFKPNVDGPGDATNFSDVADSKFRVASMELFTGVFEQF